MLAGGDRIIYKKEKFWNFPVKLFKHTVVVIKKKLKSLFKNNNSNKTEQIRKTNV